MEVTLIRSLPVNGVAWGKEWILRLQRAIINIFFWGGDEFKTRGSSLRGDMETR